MSNTKSVSLVRISQDLRQSIARLLDTKEDLRIQSHPDVTSFLHQYNADDAACVFFDPEDDPNFALVRRVRQQGDDVPILIVSEDADTVVRAMEQGADEGLSRSIAPPELEKLLDRLLVNPVDEEIHVPIVHVIEKEPSQASQKNGSADSVIKLITSLPKRQRETLECLLDGDTERQCAEKLKISPHTVHDYVKNIHRHFDVHSRAELLAKCLPVRYS